MQYRNRWNIITTAAEMAEDGEALAIAKALGIRLPTAQLLKNRGAEHIRIDDSEGLALCYELGGRPMRVRIE